MYLYIYTYIYIYIYILTHTPIIYVHIYTCFMHMFSNHFETQCFSSFPFDRAGAVLVAVRVQASGTLTRTRSLKKWCRPRSPGVACVLVVVAGQIPKRLKIFGM